ncbi:MAG: hypothetical protein LBI56_02590 [Puniceicoccales bacterium]|jgi:hypothetical protein|nr:hypothetical protein [Puniceicoccales bacterium]
MGVNTTSRRLGGQSGTSGEVVSSSPNWKNFYSHGNNLGLIGKSNIKGSRDLTEHKVLLVSRDSGPRVNILGTAKNLDLFSSTNSKNPKFRDLPYVIKIQ